MTKGCVKNHVKETEHSDEDLEHLPDRIAEIMAGRTILITGGTGFLGKVLLEKLLRSCPKVKTIYLLVREKKGIDAKQRLEEVFTNPLFDRLKKECGNDVLKKVIAVNGDVSSQGLGLSQKDRQLLIDNINIVYHAAATIRFDETLKNAVLLNTRGTKLMLELAKEMKHLQLFCHVSTAYCHLHEKVLREQPYDPPADPHKIIECMETVDEKTAIAITKKLLGSLPNTYAFTKALSEGLVNDCMDKLPIVILRPSIVIPIWKEPLPGWTDNINGPTGLLIGAGKGVIRTMYCNQNGYADFLPVDVAVSGLIVVVWNFLGNKDTEKRVYNFTSSAEIKVSWDDLISVGRKVTERVPLNNVVWYPGGSMKKSRLLHNICVFFFHLIPAYFLDALIFLAGYKPLMVRVQRRINKGFEMFEYYANNEWVFESYHADEVRKKMNAKEKKNFKIDKDGLDIESYFEDCIHAARVYILKEMPETLPAARRHLRIMYWVDVIVKIAFTFLLLWMLSKSEIIMNIVYGLLNFACHLLQSVGFSSGKKL